MKTLFGRKMHHSQADSGTSGLISLSESGSVSRSFD